MSVQQQLFYVIVTSEEPCNNGTAVRILTAVLFICSGLQQVISIFIGRHQELSELKHLIQELDAKPTMILNVLHSFTAHFVPICLKLNGYTTLETMINLLFTLRYLVVLINEQFLFCFRIGNYNIGYGSAKCFS